MLTKINYIVITLAAVIVLMFGASVQASAAEVAPTDDGLDTYLWYVDTAEGQELNLADIDTVAELATAVPECDSDFDSYVACYHHEGDPETDDHMVDTLYWGHVKVIAVDDVITSITER